MRNQKRWQDIEAVLETGIDVISTVNIQHLESLNDAIFELTEIRVRETFPDRTPANVTSTSSSPKSATSHWTGRPNVASPAPQRIDFLNGIASQALLIALARSSFAGRPFSTRRPTT